MTTNLELWSQQLDNAYWDFTSFGTVTANAGAAPDATTTADSIADSGGYAETGHNAAAVALDGTSSYTYSLCFKRVTAGKQPFLQLNDYTSGTSADVQYFNIDTLAGAGTELLVGSAVGFTGASVTSLGSGWYRCAVTFPSSGYPNIHAFLGWCDSPGSRAAASGSGLFWGAQCEIGTAFTTYVPTTSAPATGGTSYTLTAGAGSLALTGQAVGLRAGRKAVGSLGSFAIGGQTVSPRRGSAVHAAVGNFSLSGVSCAVRAVRRLPVAGASLATTGQAAGLNVGTGTRLTAAAGSFTLSGQAIALRDGRRTAVSPGAFAIGGQTGALRRAVALQATNASFSLSGLPAVPRLARRAQIGVVAFNITGLAVGIGVGSANRLTAQTGAFTITGQLAGLRATRSAGLVVGSYSLSGQPVALRSARRLLPVAGGFTFSGNPATLSVYGSAKILPAGMGSLVLTGVPAGFLRSRSLGALSGSISLYGAPASLTVTSSVPAPIFDPRIVALATIHAAFAKPILYTKLGLFSGVITAIRSDEAAPGFIGVGKSARTVTFEIPQATLPFAPEKTDTITQSEEVWKVIDITRRDDVAAWELVVTKE